MITNNRQTGGTLLGLIVGMVMGLLIAVGVALTITGSSNPFAGKADSAATAGNAKVLADPNEPLYPKRDLMESVARELSKKAEAEGKSAAEALKALTSPVLAKKEEPATTITVAPQQVAMQSSSADKPAQPVDGLIYYLQAGAFLNRNEAENVKSKLALLGLAAQLSERASDNGTLYRVRVGPYSQIEEMRQTRTLLAENGMQAVVVRP